MSSFFQVTIWSPKWRSLNPWKGHLNTQKGHWEEPGCFFSATARNLQLGEKWYEYDVCFDQNSSPPIPWIPWESVDIRTPYHMESIILHCSLVVKCLGTSHTPLKLMNISKLKEWLFPRPSLFSHKNHLSNFVQKKSKGMENIRPPWEVVGTNGYWKSLALQKSVLPNMGSLTWYPC